MSTLAILGGKGMLGSDLAKLAELGGYSTSVYDLPEFNITSEDDIRRAVSHADIIVNCAAYTQVDRAETDRKICRDVNALAVSHLANFAKKHHKYLVHISTDFVFGDNSGKRLSENDQPNPLGWYGATKLEGEQFVQSSGCHHAIIRLEWTYGRNGSNFISKVLDAAAKSPKLKVVGDQVGSPTHTADVAKALLCIIGKRAEGLYHFAAEGYASRYEVAEFILKEKKIEKELISCLSSVFPTPAKRPLNSRFDCSKIDGILDFRRPLWQDSMRKYLNG